MIFFAIAHHGVHGSVYQSEQFELVHQSDAVVGSRVRVYWRCNAKLIQHLSGVDALTRAMAYCTNTAGKLALDGAA